MMVVVNGCETEVSPVFSWDITWCSSECDNTACFRNIKNMSDRNARVFTTSDFKGTGECPVKNHEENIKNDVDNEMEI